jgi:hypothetical protein
MWWLSPRPPALAGAVFDAFAPMAQQIIYDSVGWSDPPSAVLAMTRWAKSHSTVIFNLAWRRLKPWRRILAQSLAPGLVPGALRSIELIELDHGPHALPVAWLLLGWLASRLGWQPKQGRANASDQLVWQFESDHGPIRIRLHRTDGGSPLIDRMRIAWRGDAEHPAGAADYRHEGHHIRHYPSDATLLPSSIPAPEQHPEQMVAAQLAHRAGDALFAEAIAISEAMARVMKPEGATALAR